MVQVNIYIVLLFFTVVCVVALIFSYFGAKIVKGLSPKSMYNVATCLVFASILSGCMSLWAVWIALPNAHNVDYTHQDVIVDILGVLVTILMGWNIISVVDFKNRAERLEGEVEKRVNRIDTLRGDLDHVVSGVMKLCMYSFPIKGNKPELINSCFKSLEEIIQCKDPDVCKSAFEQNMRLLHKILASYQDDEVIFVFNEKLSSYKYILEQIPQNQYKKEIIDKINNAKELSIKENDFRIIYEKYEGSVDGSVQGDSKMGSFVSQNDEHPSDDMDVS